MTTGARLELKQTHNLVMTLQMQQSLKLLQLSNLELDAYIQGELERNPLLAVETAESSSEFERDDDRDNRDVDAGLDFAPGRAESGIDGRFDDIPVDGSPRNRAGADPAAPDSLFAADGSNSSGKGGSFEGDGDGVEHGFPRDPTLPEFLASQLAVCGLSGPERAIAIALIDEVDESGYLRCELAEVAERLGCDLERVEAVLARLQGFEPAGVFARDLAECLAIQLKDRNRLDPAMLALLGNLDRLVRGDLAGLRRLCGVDEEDLREMIGEIRSLSPRPGAAFGGDPIQPVVPDIFIRKGADGAWGVELNADTLPRLLVDQRYHAEVAGAAREESEKLFVSNCFAHANWLVKSLDQRTTTILKVAVEIVKQQQDFLESGIAYLRPLNLRTVAGAIGMHESTVSRVTSNKYMATPRGVFEMRFFFTASIQAVDGGETHGAEAVRHKIRTLIDSEGAGGGVLSDDRIVQLLKDAGMEIARRTVTKYREAMRIPSSTERRRRLKVA